MTVLPQPDAKAAEGTLEIGTFNVRWANPDDGEHRWEKRRERLLAMLCGWAPDVLGLQEPLRVQLDLIQQSLAAYERVGVGREDGREAGEFCAIFYRKARFECLGSGTFWLSDTPDVPGSRHWGNRNTRICTWVHLRERENESAFYVYNVHLDHESQRARDKGVSLLLERVRQRLTPDPVVVLGDFNAGPRNAAIARMGAADSPVPTRALERIAPALSGTFHGFTGDADEEPIDHIFLSSGWEIKEAGVLRGDSQRPFISDHFPVKVTLRRQP